MISDRRYFLQGDDNQIKNVITSVTLLKVFAYHACFQYTLGKAYVPIEALVSIKRLMRTINSLVN